MKKGLIGRTVDLFYCCCLLLLLLLLLLHATASGLAVVCQVLSEAPMFWVSDKILAYVGEATMLGLSLLAYVCRVWLLSILNNVSPCEFEMTGFFG